MEAAGCPAPEYRQNEFMVYATIRQHKDTEANELNGQLNGPVNDPVNGSVKKLPLIVQKVYVIIRDNEGIRRPGIVEQLGASDSTVKRCVAILVEENLIEHRGSAKIGGYYAK